VDALIENVLAHTDAGVPFLVSLRQHEGRAELTIADGGDGLSQAVESAVRADQTSGGKGLVKARRCAELSGGAMRVGRSHWGGAKVTLLLGLA
jgi:signal transduction histidine kinase